MEWHTTTRLGEKQSMTPEGFLLARDVPVARTGIQWYHPAELAMSGLDLDGSGPVAVERDPAEVFHPKAIASLAGKPITINHPATAVGPRDWRDLAVGTVHNPRADADRGVLLADLLLADQRGIDAVRSGTRAVSVGYDAQYEPVGPGRARQRNIVCNHVALVDEGRCGATCMIGDSARGQFMSGNITAGGAAPGGGVGPFKRHGRFRGRATGAFVLPDPDDPDFFVVWENVASDDLMDLGRITTGGGGVPAYTGDVREARMIREQEHARQRAQLRAINEHNRRQWGG